ncbi:MAG: PilN domain-containing protein [Planctomycetes bacterium]|jgi:hypothetical protein|nr:PilN domain-containing protein [Planctomycetota bacterium]
MSDVNLIPMARLAGRRRRGRLYFWAALCGTYALLVAVGASTFHVARAGQGRREAQQVETIDRQIEQETRALQGLRRQLQETTTALETTQAIRDQPDWSKLLVGLSAQVDDEIVLSRCHFATFTADQKAVTVETGGSLSNLPLGTFLTECRHGLTLNGYGKSQEAVARFVLRLEGCGVFDRVRLVNSSRQSFLNGEAVAFSVECNM